MLITFATLIDVARINGLPFPEVFPVVVDVGMVASMITAAQFRLRGITGRWLAYLAFMVLSLVSVVANATHAQGAADLSQTTIWASALVGAVPSATLLVITHLVMKLIPDEKERTKLLLARERQTRTESSTAQSASAKPGAPRRVAMSTRSADVSSDASPALTLVPVTADQSGADSAEVQEMILAHVAETGEKPTGKVVGEWLGGKSAKTGQRFLAKMAERQPHEHELEAVGATQ